MDFLQLAGKSILVMGIANRKSIAYHVARILRDAEADLILSVRSEERRQQISDFFPDVPVLICDVERSDEIDRLADQLAQRGKPLAGLLHSIAFANYAEGMRPFHETARADFLQALDISCYSLIAVSNALKEHLEPSASVVSISISTTRMAAENYGFMAPIKAALDSTLVFLAKSFSDFSEIRFNAVCPGLLKTSASAGIPGYVDSYLFAEYTIPRRRAVATQEAANAAAFLLSPRSSGINAQGIVVDAGMNINYFDREIVRRVTRDPAPDR